jgi:hypothetical protein
MMVGADGGANGAGQGAVLLDRIIANIVGARLYQGQQIRKKKNNGIDL